MIAVDTETAVIYNGVNALVQVLQNTRAFVCSLDGAHSYAAERDAIRTIVFDAALNRYLKAKANCRAWCWLNWICCFVFRNGILFKSCCVYLSA